MHIYVTAESFGLGPVTAVNELVTLVKTYNNDISFTYVGEPFTTDYLHRTQTFPGEVINMPVAQYLETRPHNCDDTWLVAMDNATAVDLLSYGKKVVFYDELAWFWDETPPSVQRGAHWLCLNFFGVEQKVRATNNLNTATIINPWRAPPPRNKNGTTTENTTPYTLINLGGVYNPIHDEKVLQKWVKLTETACREAISTLGLPEPLHIGSKYAVSQLTQKTRKRVCTTNQTANLAYNSELMLCTPGLGNIWLSAHTQTRTVFLPAINDSQHLQHGILATNKITTHHTLWNEITEKKMLKHLTQEERLQWITECVLNTQPHDYASAIVKTLQSEEHRTFHTSQLFQLFPPEQPFCVAKKIYKTLTATSADRNEKEVQ